MKHFHHVLFVAALVCAGTLKDEKATAISTRRQSH